MVSFEDVVHQLVEWSGLPVPIGCNGWRCLSDLAQNLIGSEALREARFFEGLLSSAAVVKTMPFQNSNRVERGSGQLGQGEVGCHELFSSV
jgi:hypothetical protein